MIALKPDFLVTQVLYVQAPIVIGSVQTDKKHFHEMYWSLETAYTLISYQAAIYNEVFLCIIIYAVLLYLKMQPVR